MLALLLAGTTIGHCGVPIKMPIPDPVPPPSITVPDEYTNFAIPYESATEGTIQNVNPSKPENDWVVMNPKMRDFLISNRMEHLQIIIGMEHAQAEYAQLYYQHQAENLRINEDAFVWAKHQSVFIFVVAHVLLFVGIGAAYYEFRNAMKLRQKAWQQDEIKIELEGVALKTSLNAIWLLLGAFVFYFLYIKYVYTITVVG